MSTTGGDAGAEPANAATVTKPLGMRINGMLLSGLLVPSIPTWPWFCNQTGSLTPTARRRQTMARAQEGLPSWLRADLVRETRER